MQCPRPGISIMIALMLLVGCNDPASDIKADSTTPEGAILLLEQAFRNKDIEAAVAAKDFRIEARLMLEKVNPEAAVDDETLRLATEVLELGFRKEMEQRGFPDFDNIKTSFPRVEPYRDNIVVVTEVQTFPDGGTARQQLLVAKTDSGWKVLHVLK
jgi:hypothetical protein